MKAIGIDIGTSGAKGVLVSFPDGKVLASKRVSYPLYAEGNRAEHDPEDWVKATLEILEELGPADAIGLDGMMHSEVCLGTGDRAILWCDGRAEAQCDEIIRKIGFETLRETVANRPFAGFTLPHLLWRKKHLGSTSGLPRHGLGTVLICKDYVRYKLTGELRQESSDAASTLCWDVARGRWATAMMKNLGLDPALFPPPVGSIEIAGHWNGIPVVGGAADNAAAAVGVGVVREGQALVSMGTSNVLLVVHDTPVVDPEMRVHTFTHAVPGRFYQIGCMLTGTRAFDWICRLLGVAVDDAPIADDSKGLLFAPYLVGERTPHADTALRGMFAGISTDHDKQHFVRAVLEGTAFALKDAHAIAGGTSVRVTGGGMKNPAWRQIVADVLGVPVVTVNTSDEGAAYGSAILAAVGVGEFKSVDEACDRLVHETSVTTPRRSYAEEYGKFQRLHPAAKAVSLGVATNAAAWEAFRQKRLAEWSAAETFDALLSKALADVTQTADALALERVDNLNIQREVLKLRFRTAPVVQQCIASAACRTVIDGYRELLHRVIAETFDAHLPSTRRDPSLADGDDASRVAGVLIGASIRRFTLECGRTVNLIVDSCCSGLRAAPPDTGEPGWTEDLEPALRSFLHQRIPKEARPLWRQICERVPGPLQQLVAEYVHGRAYCPEMDEELQAERPYLPTRSSRPEI